jgi:NADPH:quinone reductase-like Zn-dependent oxidoreductase
VELCKSLGADQVIDYRKDNVATALQGLGIKFDLIVDNVGSDPEIFYKAHAFTTAKARYIMAAGVPSFAFLSMTFKMKNLPGFLGGGKLKLESMLAEPKTEQLEQIGVWMKEGKVKAIIDSRFKFGELPKAFEKLKTGRARGKIVVEVVSDRGIQQ